ncbi:SCP2 sterol-binding domain-containing protein [Longispora sp. K20-0274]|uniref:SCP2 sterol-binding domain-containing protein n=1 Tax=Longispora sp. K20-0274 TaxID=3088255 RepID=UPI00399C3D03
MIVTAEQWRAVRAALRDTTDRFADLVLAARPEAMATAHWTVTDTAAHVTAIAWLYTFLVRFDDTALPYADVARQVPLTTVDTVADLNALVLGEFTERDPRALAGLLRAHVATILAAAGDEPATRPVPWLGDSRVPLAGVLAHLVNELLVHGRDIARAVRAPWTVGDREAAMFFELFLVGMLRHDHGRVLDTGQRVRDRRIAVRFRSAYTTPVTLVLRAGRVTVADPGPDDDVRLAFAPAALSLMLFGRLGRPRAVLTGKLRVAGRVWLLPEFLRTVRLPS